MLKTLKAFSKITTKRILSVFSGIFTQNIFNKSILFVSFFKKITY